MTTKAVRIAVAGAGMIGRRHAAIIRVTPDCILSAIVDPAPAAADFAHTLGVPLFGSLAELLAVARPDGVVLATPNPLHVEQALACVAAGVPVLVEKPLADTLEGGIRLCEAADATRAPILVGHHRRHGAIMAKAVEIVGRGTLGSIVAVVGTALFYKAESEGYFDEAPWRRESGGGPILINMIHEIGNLRALCGEIVAVQALSSNARRGFPVEDTVAIGLRFASGALGTFLLSDGAASARSWEQTSRENEAYASYPDEDCYHVAGTQGSLGIPTMRMRTYARAAERSWHTPFETRVLEVDDADPLARQLEHFCAVVRGEADPLVTVRDGVQNLRVTEAIAAAGRTGTTIVTG